MAKSFDRNSYGSARRSSGAVRPSARSGATANPRYRQMGASGPQGAQGADGGMVRVGSAGAGASGGNPYSRNSFNKSSYDKERKRKKRNRVLAVCLSIVLVLILGGAGFAFAYISKVENNLEVDPEVLKVLDTTAPGEPFYMLLMGTDKSADRAADDEYGGAFRTDSIMLLRIDPQEKHATVISLMRDTMVDMDSHGKQKLNAAYAFGGAPYAIEVVSKMAGVPISHYAEIDFDGFRDVVNALGGVDVNVPIEIDDDEAGGYLAAGQQTLNGDQALILCRSRHAYDDYGKGDEYRAANQRLVISAIAKKILGSDLVTMMSTVETLSNYVTTDMGVQDILALANSMRGMDMDSDFYSCVNPTTSQYIDNVWWEILDEAEWKRMIQRVEQGLPPVESDVVDEQTGTVMATAGSGEAAAQATAAPKVHRTGTVSVRNGTDINGAGAAAQEKIQELGYTVNTGNANSAGYGETVIVFEDDDQREYAQEIADVLGVGKVVKNNNEYLYDADFLVVIGSDWQ